MASYRCGSCGNEEHKEHKYWCEHNKRNGCMETKKNVEREVCKELVNRIIANREELGNIRVCLEIAGKALVERLYMHNSMSIRQIARVCGRSPAYIKSILNGQTISQEAFIKLVEFESREA